MSVVRHYYNENNAYAARWLRKLIAAGELPPGDVDERSIVDVRAHELDGYVQHHFFAGIGGWPLALRYAGWRDDRPIFTGSCPCQPFSAAGKKRGFADKRHLWPVWRELIRERRPPAIAGEQVANVPEWLAGVRGDLVGMGYAVGAIPIEAACAGGHQRRDRYWFVACDPGQHDGSADTEACAGQEPEFRGGLLSGHDSGRSRTYAGRIVPDAGIPPLAHEIPNRLGRTSAIGNAIDPVLASHVLRAFMDGMRDMRLSSAPLSAVHG